MDHTRQIMLAVIAACTVTFAITTHAADPEPYIGLGVRNSDQGLLISWILPGPLGGTGFESASGLKRADIIESINDVPITDADSFQVLIDQSSVGDRIAIDIRRSTTGNTRASVPTAIPPASTDIRFTVQATLADKDQWTGTVTRGWHEGSAPTPITSELQDSINRLAEIAGLTNQSPSQSDLITHIRAVHERLADPNALPIVASALTNPFSLSAVEQSLYPSVTSLAESSDPVTNACQLTLHQLNIPPIDPAADLANATIIIANVPPLNITPQHAMALARRLRDNVSIMDTNAEQHIKLIQASKQASNQTIAIAAATLPALHQWLDNTLTTNSSNQPIQVPNELRFAIQGDILLAYKTLLGWLVIGSTQDNTYDTSMIAFIADPGGTDTYNYPAPNSRPAQVIIDVQGDDLYTSSSDFAGPASAILGSSLIDDRAGDDRYISTKQGSIAFALFGIAIILDQTGDDLYQCDGPNSGWSTASALYGAGIILDRAGNDRYLAEKLSQAAAGPRAIALLIDSAGDDLYTADGPNFPSVYGTPNTYFSQSQGFAMGIRRYAAGGLGALYDLAGDDIYKAGEFSQACGYYLALGILHDALGDDQYLGNRYSQAAAAHQACAVLIDEQGNDHYRGVTAASQAGAWDESAVLLMDFQGNDTYQAHDLCQGSAAMQAIAVLVDAGGDDSYTSTAPSAQGQSGSDTYHYDATGLYSFSVLLDNAGDDSYSTGRTNNQITSTGKPNPDHPDLSTLSGLFADQELSDKLDP